MPSELALVLRVPGSADYWSGFLVGVVIVGAMWILEARRRA